MPPLAAPPDESLSARQAAPALLLAVAAVLPAVPQTLLPGVAAATAPVALLALGLCDRALLGRVEASVLALWAWAALSLAWTVDAGQSVLVLMGWLGGAAVLLAARGRAPALGVGVAVAVLACAALALRQLGGMADVGELARSVPDADARGFAELWIARRRLMGPFNSPDMLAAFLLPTLGITAAMALQEERGAGPRAAAVAVTGLGALVFLFTQSAGAALAALVAVGGAGAAGALRRRRVGLATTFVFAGTLLVLAVFWMRSARPDASAWTSGRERWEDWLNALEMVGRAPWWGVGAGAFESAFNNFSPPRRYSAYAHSVVLQFAVELGPTGALLALVAYGVVGAWALRWILRGERAEAVAGMGVLAAVIHHQLDYDAHHLSGVGLWLAVAWLRATTTLDDATEREWPAPARLGAGLAFVAAAWVCAGLGLADRGVPRLPGDEPNLASTRAGARLLRYDARAQLSLTEDLLLAIRAGLARGENVDALWAEHDSAAQATAAAAPWLPAGPMLLARGRFARGSRDDAMAAYQEAIRRACCSRRLHEERLMLARMSGDAAVAAEDEAWLREGGFVVPQAGPPGDK